MKCNPIDHCGNWHQYPQSMDSSLCFFKEKKSNQRVIFPNHQAGGAMSIYQPRVYNQIEYGFLLDTKSSRRVSCASSHTHPSLFIFSFSSTNLARKINMIITYLIFASSISYSKIISSGLKGK